MSCHCCCKCSNKEHTHCYHPFMGPIHMVIPEGYSIEECCMCGDTKLVYSNYHGWHGKSNAKPMWDENPYRYSNMMAS